MRRNVFVCLIALFYITTLSTLSAQGSSRENPLQDSYLYGLGYLDLLEAKPPFVPLRDGKILFSFDSRVQASAQSITSNQVRSAQRVQVAFGHEQFKILHPMARNSRGIFILLYELDRKIREDLLASKESLSYRYVVDGVWMADPVNPDRAQKLGGALISYYDMSNMPPLDLRSPEYGESKSGLQQIRLRYVGRPGDEVYVGASFNAFDPYLHMLRESRDSPGLFEIDLRLRAGQYTYYYVVNGQKIKDPLNKAKAYNKDGIAYSRIDIR